MLSFKVLRANVGSIRPMLFYIGENCHQGIFKDNFRASHFAWSYQMGGTNIADLAQIISSFAMIMSVIYLAKQIRLNQKIMKLQFGFNLNDRLYKRYFESSQNENFSKFLAKNWREDDFEDFEYWRMTLWIQTCLVDLFDSYDQFKSGVIGREHLEMRMHLIKSGIMKTRMGKPTWEFWKKERDKDFVVWFEKEVFGAALKSDDTPSDELDKFNMIKK